MSKDIFLQIINGWCNYIKREFDILPDNIKEIAKNRLLLCNDCDLREGRICHPRKSAKNINTQKIVFGCGCNIAAKTLSMNKNTKCPIDKW